MKLMDNFTEWLNHRRNPPGFMEKMQEFDRNTLESAARVEMFRQQLQALTGQAVPPWTFVERRKVPRDR